MSRSPVYYWNSQLGEAEIYPRNSDPGIPFRGVRISHLSPPSERCPPLAVLHTVGFGGIRFKMESESSENPPLVSLHAACLRDNKTAVVSLGGGAEVHLVAMAPRKGRTNRVCFWGFSVASAVYNNCIAMLNLRTLAIVFDLDQTLLVAYTLPSIQEKIDRLHWKISNESDPQRAAAISAEIKRHEDDRAILKEYAENDQVVENGTVYKVQAEIVPALSESRQEFVRPIIRLKEKNIILTRTHTLVRNTSVLVRLRPGWEDLRSYLMSRGRKRFEVYVCTMAHREYALEMWRLLDPDSSLIKPCQVLDRVVCVDPGSKKSLQRVFQRGTCHPNMALVIDDRINVWDEKDQSRVHVVPAFAPHSAPQAEVNSDVPVLSVVKNVVCNVRSRFFKSLDEEFLPRICKLVYEDEDVGLPSAPDVSTCVILEDITATCTSSGKADAEVERRLKEASRSVETVHPGTSNLQHIMPSSSGAVSFAATHSMMPVTDSQSSQSIQISRPHGQSGLETGPYFAPGREEGEVSESELDPNTRRRLLILLYGQDTGDFAPFPVRPPCHLSVPPVQSQGNWFHLDEGMNMRQPQTLHYDKKRPPNLCHEEKTVAFDIVRRQHRRVDAQSCQIHDRLLQHHAALNSSSFPGY
ncbi:RNA polymerase II C-terminal domain phosphatase-like 1 [Typha angustifolia]|uniref:RNA polymerase II C-terminal domain phosphatase-like 1 n=1 Tax=Typha angustifolia TaxID=59011 RepID=UPI003C2BC05B